MSFIITGRSNHAGFLRFNPKTPRTIQSPKFNDEFESRMASWPIPSLVQEMTGTWLADLLNMTYSSGAVIITKDAGGKLSESREGVIAGFSKMVALISILAPRDLLLKEPRPVEIFLNTEYMAEMQSKSSHHGRGPDNRLETARSTRKQNRLPDPIRVKTILNRT